MSFLSFKDVNEQVIVALVHVIAIIMLCLVCMLLFNLITAMYETVDHYRVVTAVRLYTAHS